MEEETLWRSVEDPASGRTYYYHTETRETQWSKPLELASADERKAIEEKERQQREFFAAMEANILNSIAVGNFAKTNQEIVVPTLIHDTKTRPVTKEASRRTQMIRTISSMEDSVLVDLVCRVPSTRNIFRSVKQQDDVKEIVFQPEAAEATPTTSRKLPTPEKVPTVERVAKNISVLPNLSLLEATKRTNRSFLMEAKMASKNSLNAIDEFDSLNGSAMQLDLDEFCYLDIEEAPHDDDERGERNTLSREASFGTLLKQLPKEGATSMRSLYGTSSFDESKLSFRLTIEETEALEELAMVSEEMAKIGNQGMNDFDIDFTSTRDMMYLRDIHEGSQSEDETETEENDCEASTDGVGALPPTIDVGAGTPRMKTQNEYAVIMRGDSMRLTGKLKQQSSQKTISLKPSFERRNTCGNLVRQISIQVIRFPAILTNEYDLFCSM